MSQPTSPSTKPPLIARADFQYRWRVYVFFIMVFGYGAWSFHDGFYKWPAENRAWDQMRAENKTPPQVNHNDAGILINRGLGIILPGFSLPLFIWLMVRSRGAYRLENDILHLPGHDPIPLDKIEALDKSRWDRKGIAVVEYQTAGGAGQSAILRDMVYERRATDQIVEVIEKSLGDVPASDHSA
ncbi:MAG TPA: hypothetical protein VIM11_18060 [Tepidisphaeraceae bacterium]|jgi:hypothetical protein